MAFRVKDEAVNNKLAITTKSLLQQLLAGPLRQRECSTCGGLSVCSGVIFEVEELQ